MVRHVFRDKNKKLIKAIRMNSKENNKWNNVSKNALILSMGYLDYLMDSLTDNTVAILNLKSLIDEERQRARDFVRGYRYESLGKNGEISSLLICTLMDVKIGHLTLD